MVYLILLNREGGQVSYTYKIREIIDRFADPEQGYTIPKAAQEIHDWLLQYEPELLDGWLHEQAQDMIRNTINARDRSLRAYVRQVSGRSVFRDAIEAYERGEPEELRNWSQCVFVVNEEQARKQLRDMTAPELRYVSRDYRMRARQAQMMAQFLDAIANRIGDGKVEDYFTDEQLRTMWNSLGQPL